MSKTMEQRFWAKVALPNEHGCMLWLASRQNSGYGQFRPREGGMALAHRVSYEIANGAIPDGLQIDHLCRVRHCVAPPHLEAVTHAENVRRGEAGLWRPEACKHGHPFTFENTYRRRDGSRSCRTCERTRALAYADKKRNTQ